MRKLMASGLGVAAAMLGAALAASTSFPGDNEGAPGSAKNRPGNNKPVPGGGSRERQRRQARIQASRDKQLRALYRAHRIHCDAPLGGQDDTIPTTRTDLLELYTAILDHKVETPYWAVSVLKD